MCPNSTYFILFMHLYIFLLFFSAFLHSLEFKSIIGSVCSSFWFPYSHSYPLFFISLDYSLYIYSWFIDLPTHPSAQCSQQCGKCWEIQHWPTSGSWFKIEDKVVQPSFWTDLSPLYHVIHLFIFPHIFLYCKFLTLFWTTSVQISSFPILLHSPYTIFFPLSFESVLRWNEIEKVGDKGQRKK